MVKETLSLGGPDTTFASNSVIEPIDVTVRKTIILKIKGIYKGKEDLRKLEETV